VLEACHNQAKISANLRPAVDGVSQTLTNNSVCRTGADSVEKAEVLTPDSPRPGKGQQGSRGVRGWGRAPTINIEPCVPFPTQREIDSRE